MKLNLGCGNDYKRGYINCDIVKTPYVDKIVDLEKKLPFKDNSVDEIIVYHVLEHINNFIQLMEEFYRICKDNAIRSIRVPFYTIPGAFGNPTHVRFFTYGTFEWFLEAYKFGYTPVRIKIIDRKLVSSTNKGFISKIIDSLVNKYPKKYQRFFAFIFPMQELKVKLKVEK